jgi:hypothetical protein
MPDSSLCRVTSYADGGYFLRFSSLPAGHGHFLPNSLQFIIRQFYYMTLYSNPRGYAVTQFVEIMLQAGGSRVRFPMTLDVFNLPNPSSHTVAVGGRLSL